ncbi:MAG: hypothetical protein ACQESE_01070 [Nanobdellota archaeon]
MSTTTPSYERETAYICSVDELLNGEYVVQDGWKPNYVNAHGRKLSRVNIMGVVVDKPELYSFMLDDGTATIAVTDFNQQKKTANLSVGDPVLVIGRPRKNGESFFIASEIINADQVKENPAWLTLRKKQLQKITSSQDPITQQEKNREQESRTEEEAEEQPVSGQGLTGDDIVDFVRKKDDGAGCDVDDIIVYFGGQAEEVVHTLITMGEVYEIRPGKIKLLE